MYQIVFFIFITGYSGFDLDNIGKGKGGGACTAAAFLKVLYEYYLLDRFATKAQNNYQSYCYDHCILYSLNKNIVLLLLPTIWSQPPLS